jgi:hypothetical protein
MKNKGTIKKILIGLVVAVVLLVAYSALNTNVETSSGTSSLSSLVGQGNLGQVQETNTALANAEILRILGSIENISLDDDIFTNPVFRELEDSRFTIPKPTRIGRPNPFLPIGFNSFSGTSSESNNDFTDESQSFFNVINVGNQETNTSTIGESEPTDFFIQS